MCTVSIIPVPAIGSRASGFRVVCNRDESWTRPAARPPRWTSIPIAGGNVAAVWPIDPAAGGTWIGASEGGLALTVLNLNLEPGIDLPETGLQSRGHLIPQLISAPTALDAIAALRQMELERFAPFRLLGVDLAEEGLRVAEARWDRRDFSVAWHGPRPVCFASSGLGDSKVWPRHRLFEELVVGRGALPEHQDEFHRHAWEDRREISVLMSRAEARTVSITTLEFVRDERPRMSYEPVMGTARGERLEVRQALTADTVTAG